mmetsp:Transcript_38129/g.43752  ORF Transcript_38129/g.43752 Transcript_38129/m.43752 type:complete len:96 (-) Transcript_38129:75-362(-)
MRLGEEHKFSKLPDFGPFQPKQSIFHSSKPTVGQLSFNERKISTGKLMPSHSIKWANGLSPTEGQKKAENRKALEGLKVTGKQGICKRQGIWHVQ